MTVSDSAFPAQLDREACKDQVFRHYDFIRLQARKRFVNDAHYEKALIFVLDGLEAGDWKRIREFQGRSSFRVYLAQVVQRLLTDFSRKEFGYLRPPKWIKDMGGEWERVYRLLCIERLSPAQVMESMKASRTEASHEKVIWAVIETIFEKIIDCGAPRAETFNTEPALLETKVPEDPSLHQLTPEKAVDEQEIFMIMQAVHHCLTSTDEGAMPNLEQKELQQKLENLRSRLRLTAEERLFLTIYSQDGYSVASAGRMLGWQTHQTSGRFRRLRERIDEAFRETGLKEVLNAMLS